MALTKAGGHGMTVSIALALLRRCAVVGEGQVTVMAGCSAAAQRTSRRLGQHSRLLGAGHAKAAVEDDVGTARMPSRAASCY